MNLFITSSNVMAMAAEAYAGHLAQQYQVPLQRRSNRTAVLDVGAMAVDKRNEIVALVSQAAGDLRLDVALMRADQNWAAFSLLASDMDSTLITIECIDEIADFCGKKSEVAAITEATMRGEIADFAESLRRRVALLANTPQAVLEQVYEQRLRLTEGAQALIDAAHSNALQTLLVSGGFTYFTERLKERLKFDRAYANTLGIENSILTGLVVGEVFGASAKRQALLDHCSALNVSPARAIAVGDGANDLPMIEAAGLSVAFHAKPAVVSAADISIRFGGLDVLVEWL